MCVSALQAQNLYNFFEGCHGPFIKLVLFNFHFHAIIFVHKLCLH